MLLLPHELLVAHCRYFMVVDVITWWLPVFCDALVLLFNPYMAQYSVLKLLNKGRIKQLKNCLRWLQLTIAVEKTCLGCTKAVEELFEHNTRAMP